MEEIVGKKTGRTIGFSRKKGGKPTKPAPDLGSCNQNLILLTLHTKAWLLTFLEGKALLNMLTRPYLPELT